MGGDIARCRPYLYAHGAPRHYYHNSLSPFTQHCRHECAHNHTVNGCLCIRACNAIAKLHTQEINTHTMQSRRKPQPGDIYQANGFRHEIIMRLPNANPNVTSLLVTTRCTRCNTATSTKCLYYRHTDLIHHVNGVVAVHQHAR